MKKKKLYIILLIIIVFLIAGSIVLLFALRDNSIGVIKLKTNVNEIYEWKYKIDDKKIVKFKKKTRAGDFEDKNGGGITEKYVFKALKPGKTNIIFTFTNRHNKSFGEIKTYRVVVDKELKITIKEKK